MINTFYGIDQLVTAPSAKTFLAAMIVGLLFGFSLERSGFGSSRKLAAIFYLRDMTVLKVMFTALITAMLGLSLVVALGWLELESQVYVLPTQYGAQIVGGLVFGVGVFKELGEGFIGFRCSMFEYPGTACQYS